MGEKENDLKVIISMEIRVVDSEGKEVVNINKRDFSYPIEEANNYYLYRIKNFVSNRLEISASKMGKATIDRWKDLLSRIEKVVSNRAVINIMPEPMPLAVEEKPLRKTRAKKAVV